MGLWERNEKIKNGGNKKIMTKFSILGKTYYVIISPVVLRYLKINIIMKKRNKYICCVEDIHPGMCLVVPGTS